MGGPSRSRKQGGGGGASRPPAYNQQMSQYITPALLFLGFMAFAFSLLSPPPSSDECAGMGGPTRSRKQGGCGGRHAPPLRISRCLSTCRQVCFFLFFNFFPPFLFCFPFRHFPLLPMSALAWEARAVPESRGGAGGRHAPPLSISRCLSTSRQI